MLTTILSFLFVLSLLVVVHEFGHFIVAKIAGIGVERFSVGMPPKLFGVRFGETDYCISAIPFGGYVTLTGQADFDKVDETDYGDKDYRKKPTLVKIAVLVAGSFMNLITAVVIFSLIFWMTGVPESSKRIGYVEENSFAAEVGFKTGDEIIAVDGSPVDRWQEVILPLYMNDGVTLTVKNVNGEHTVHVPRRLDQDEEFGIYQYFEAQVGTIVPDSPAEKAGFKQKDIILEIDGEAVIGWEHMRKVIEVNPDTEKIFTVDRAGEKIQFPVKIGHAERSEPDGSQTIIGRVGYTPLIPIIEVGFFSAVKMAVDNTIYLIVHTLDFFIKLVTGRMSAKLVGGPVMIAKMAGENAKSGFTALMGFTAFISINLGVLNLLPFPVLDGGHVLILFIESIVRRKLSTKLRMAFQQAGTLVLFLFMIYITINDVLRIDSIARLFGKN